MLDIDGTTNPADMLTKHLEPKETFFRYASYMYNRDMRTVPSSALRLALAHSAITRGGC